MKTSRLLSIMLVLSLVSTEVAVAQSSGSAVEHMTQITTPFGSFKKELWQYLKSVTQGKSARKVEKTRKKLIEQLETVSKDLKKISAFEGDASLKDAASDYMQLTTTVLKEDYAKIVDMEAIAEQSYDAMEAYMMAKELANDKLDEASDKLNAAQNVFAGAHNITLLESEDDELTKKIKSASEALKYYNAVYLIFFKPYKQEAYVLDAQQREDMGSFQQTVNGLKVDAEEGLAKIDGLDIYKGDASLKVAVKHILDFYQTEAEKDFPKVADFHLKRDEFDKLRAAIEGMRESERTKADIDKYNKAAEEFNAAIKSYNEDNQALNEKRAKYLNRWSEAVDQFLSAHSK
ncbi:MAG: hypothetical protein GC178_15960 [Flavobacteriales bacterium]|nr:hypothetical protein [Flavobacteriales bacterium]